MSSCSYTLRAPSLSVSYPTHVTIASPSFSTFISFSCYLFPINCLLFLLSPYFFHYRLPFNFIQCSVSFLFLSCAFLFNTSCHPRYTKHFTHLPTKIFSSTFFSFHFLQSLVIHPPFRTFSFSLCPFVLNA